MRLLYDEEFQKFLKWCNSNGFHVTENNNGFIDVDVFGKVFHGVIKRAVISGDFQLLEPDSSLWQNFVAGWRFPGVRVRRRDVKEKLPDKFQKRFAGYRIRLNNKTNIWDLLGILVQITPNSDPYAKTHNTRVVQLCFLKPNELRKFLGENFEERYWEIVFGKEV